MTLRDIFSFPVTQLFGVPEPESPSGIHTGVDLGLPLGTPVPAEGAGVVESVFADPIGGNQVKVKYTSGAEGWFAHLQSIFVRPGEQVAPTTEIATSGATGLATGPHLHFEERDPMGNLIDPTTAQAHTYIGGLAAGHDNGCPAGTHPALFGCAPDTVPGSLSPAPPPGSSPAFDPLGGVSEAITHLGDELSSGAKQIAVAGVIIGAVAILGYSGLRRALD